MSTNPASPDNINNEYLKHEVKRTLRQSNKNRAIRTTEHFETNLSYQQKPRTPIFSIPWDLRCAVKAATLGCKVSAYMKSFNPAKSCSMLSNDLNPKQYKMIRKLIVRVDTTTFHKLTVSISASVNGRSEQLWHDDVVSVVNKIVSNVASASTIPTINIRNQNDGLLGGSDIAGLVGLESRI